MSAEVLRVEGLCVSYDHPRGAVRAVDDVSFSLRAHERFGLAGESGSGKSTMALAILRLIEASPQVPARLLAAELGWQTLDFKANVRKLKALGLTVSHEIGYELSDAGHRYLATLASE